MTVFQRSPQWQTEIDAMKMLLDESLKRISAALDEADNVDGAHHKQFSIDQMVRALTGCPMVTRTALDYMGNPYDYEARGESAEYLQFVRAYRAGEDGPETYEWDEGTAP